MRTQLQAEINKVDAEKIRPLRHAELRKGQDFFTTSYLKDCADSTFHIACIIDDKAVTCATFYPETSKKIKSENAYRLRGMATDSSFRRKGYARQLMRIAFLELKSKGADFVWCHARLVALDFYKSLGFIIKGDLFDLDIIGPHYYMHKQI